MATDALQTALFEFENPLLRAAAVGFSTPKPSLPLTQLAGILFEGWGLDGRLTDLGGERDSNTLVETEQGARYVLKVFSPEDGEDIRQLQHCAMRHLTQHSSVPTPALHPTLAGAFEHPVLHNGDAPLFAALIDMMTGTAPQPDGSEAQMRMIGRSIGALQSGLSGLRHPAARRVLLWDQMNVLRLRELSALIADADLKLRVQRAMDHLEGRMDALAALPSAIIHNDLSPSNMLVDPADPLRLTAIFDFGDLVEAPLINDIAIAASYFIRPAAPLAPQLACFVAGYEEHRRLGDDELAALPDALLSRLLLRLVIPLWRSTLFPANRAYLLRHFEAAQALAEPLLPPRSGPIHPPLRFSRSDLKGV
ncbi:phosphotransferase enzyme family protein [Salipiger sp. PrR002]|uniref:phosphotransferase enzyme family protein n=1 Tax=Salipiger sp. PrR002 TaxID=2706489 RepID=UPI0013B980F2|nr:phosphotransferase [Salipiger sp. PrR002]NDW02663.1 phosphotransferase [Salipiger sp. PrR002]NDW59919.1 phosphotransferase [Salipiger sp. PrR004]